MARRIVNKPILSVAASQEAPDELHVTVGTTAEWRYDGSGVKPSRPTT